MKKTKLMIVTFAFVLILSGCDSTSGKDDTEKKEVVEKKDTSVDKSEKVDTDKILENALENYAIDTTLIVSTQSIIGCAYCGVLSAEGHGLIKNGQSKQNVASRSQGPDVTREVLTPIKGPDYNGSDIDKAFDIATVNYEGVTATVNDNTITYQLLNEIENAPVVIADDTDRNFKSIYQNIVLEVDIATEKITKIDSEYVKVMSYFELTSEQIAGFRVYTFEDLDNSTVLDTIEFENMYDFDLSKFTASK